MKTLADLKNVITHPEFLKNQFSVYNAKGDYIGKDKNILFINPQLCSKDLYRVFLPYFSLSETVGTAIHHISNYNPQERIMGGKETQLDDYMIDWANYIVFPFTTQPLVLALYNRIRARNLHCKIVYLIDFNFYELRPTHPFYSIFKDETTIKYVEDNMFYSDLVIVSNPNLVPYILTKWREEVIPKKYINEHTKMAISYQPFFTDIEFVLANVKFTPQKLSLHKKEIVLAPAAQQRIDETTKAANTVKKNKINIKNKAAKKHSLKTAQIKKVSKHAAKTKPAKAKRKK